MNFLPHGVVFGSMYLVEKSGPHGLLTREDSPRPGHGEELLELRVLGEGEGDVTRYEGLHQLTVHSLLLLRGSPNHTQPRL